MARDLPRFAAWREGLELLGLPLVFIKGSLSASTTPGFFGRLSFEEGKVLERTMWFLSM